MVFALLLVPGIAGATPHPLPFSYNYETLMKDQLEIEQYADLVPIRVQRMNADGSFKNLYDTAATLVTEIEYGLTDRIELGFYFQLKQEASADGPALLFDGVKQRLRIRLGEPGKWPVDVGLYLELAEAHDELELEEKILLQKRFGKFIAVANLWVEQEYRFQSDAKEVEFIYNPTVGVTYQVSPKLFAGIEYWTRGHFESKADAPAAPHYLGPAFMVQTGKVFLSVGAYLRLDKLTTRTDVDDEFGKVWVRTLLGIEL